MVALPAYAKENHTLELLADFTFREHVPAPNTTSTVEGKVRSLFNILDRHDVSFTVEELSYRSKIAHKCARYICVRLMESGEVESAGERPPLHKGRPAPLYRGTPALAVAVNNYNQLYAEIISEKLANSDLPPAEVHRRALSMLSVAYDLPPDSSLDPAATIAWKTETHPESVTYRALGCFAQAHGTLDYTYSRVHELVWSHPNLHDVPQTEYRSAPIVIRPTGFGELD